MVIFCTGSEFFCRSQLDTLMQHSPYRGRRSIYAENTAVTTGNMIAVDA